MINLFVSYYQDKNEVRQKELDIVFEKNVANPSIDKMYVVVDSGIKKLAIDKAVFIGSDHRYTYREYFELINSVTHDNDINILCNSDIYFENLSLLKYIGQNECYVLSRWDVGPDGIVKLFNRADTQDTWIFRGKIKTVDGCDFSTGRPGCDNKIALLLEQAGYKVLNPSKDIKTFHLHNSGIRNYDATAKSKERIPPPYKQIWPHHLETNNWITDLSRIAKIKSNTDHSQFSEDVLIAYIFVNIKVTNKFFVDIGAGAYDGAMSNTRKLKEQGWLGFGIDAADSKDPWIIKEFVTPKNICRILNEQQTPKEFDLLNLDIDSSDFWVLKELLKEYSPRLICTEFNGVLDPNESLVLEYEDGYTWDKTNKYGYSFAAGKKLLEENGYSIIYNLHDTNIFAVRKDIISGIVFPEVKAKRNIYHPINVQAKWATY